MNIDELTISQAKELFKLFSGTTGEQKKDHPFVGKYCIARCYAAGVHVGKVVSIDGENVILENSKRLWKWKARDGVALSGVAQAGISIDECKIDVENPLIYLSGICELIPCSEKSKGTIYGEK